MRPIIKLLDKNHVFAHLEAENKEDLLKKLISSFESEVGEEELKAVKNAIFEREKIMSTGVGKGLAIPHGKADGIKNNLVAFALLDSPIDYKAVDEEPVSMVFLLAGPGSSNSLHIKTLSRISRLMNDNSFREELEKCTSAEEIIAVFEQGEKSHFEQF